jgi:hypothetical protein
MAINPKDSKLAKKDDKSSSPEKFRSRYAIVSIVFVVVAAVAAVPISGISKVHQNPVEGITVFAILYVLAIAIERFTEVILPLLDWAIAQNRTEKADTKKSEAIQIKKNLANFNRLTRATAVSNLAIANLATSLSRAQNVEVELSGDASEMEKAVSSTEKTASAADTTLKSARTELLVLTSAFNFSLALLITSYFKFSLVGAIGFSNVADWVEIAITAAAIMGGSKGVHDVLSKVEKSSETSEEKQ